MKKRGVFVILLFVLVSSVIALTGDFDNNGVVEFSDFTLFAKGFNDYNQDGKYDPIFDLNNDTNITITDFFIFSDNYGKTNETNVSLRPAALSKPSTLLKGDFDGSGCVDNNDFNFAENEIKNWINEVKNSARRNCNRKEEVADLLCREQGLGNHVEFTIYNPGFPYDLRISYPLKELATRGEVFSKITCENGIISSPQFVLNNKNHKIDPCYDEGNNVNEEIKKYFSQDVEVAYGDKRRKFSGNEVFLTNGFSFSYSNGYWRSRFDQLFDKYNLEGEYDLNGNLIWPNFMWDANDKEEFKKLLGQGCIAPKTVESFASCNNFQNDEDKNKCLIISASKHSIVNEYCFDDNKNFDESKCTPENIGICDSIKDSINRQNEINLKKLCNEKYKLYVEASRSRVIR